MIEIGGITIITIILRRYSGVSGVGGVRPSATPLRVWIAATEIAQVAQQPQEAVGRGRLGEVTAQLMADVAPGTAGLRIAGDPGQHVTRLLPGGVGAHGAQRDARLGVRYARQP
ncbi:MAG TPA: hypothetical protein VHB98_10410, partial [Chloroflexota bacterium]|nr:hypothetical protein [Chloroflexota bacterium]